MIFNMDHCDHRVIEDENFLLDDNNVKNRTCVKCKKNQWTSDNEQGNSINWGQNNNGTFYGHENSVIATIIDDHSDNLEDSPLLINDCCRERGEAEFHCHDTLATIEDVDAWKKLLTAALLCFSFMFAELLGGYLAGSLAIMTDAAHMFSDFIGFAISLLALWVGKKPPSKTMTFGFYRVEVIGALLSVLTIWMLAIIFCTLAINRLYNRDYEIESDTMIIVSSLGLVMNLIMGFVLYGKCYSSHGHSHGSINLDVQVRAGMANGASANINVRAAAVHVLGDLVQSVGVLLAALIIKFCPGSEIADPICTLLFSLIVISTTVRVGKDSIWYLIEGSPINTSKLRAELKKLADVKHVHNLHVWSLSPGKNAIAVHLAVDQYCDRDILLKKVTSVIQNQIFVVSCTIQIEAYNNELTSSCKQCQMLQC